ncbi:hypothetical protein BCIN_08g04620 [Botrytis cinerea B05.10]|uniref:Uncharacterized protein n=2 Tax=Botryotinia fuckeliana TaxID=40559 RepID=A0A384JR38_BOTFB|nr:hypothetical protein BCIN_08g04620 [Botrytis cinerea B05.10]ATZ52834.1 hypothetical protein BCIN_08g04620 [Botrytis cinerea B05.10]CCD42576.1 hypothetical protein BofuT4_P076590.1 [Botrytis cinerea T4]
MLEDGDEVPRLLRDRYIKAVRDRFHRPPTVNELRAIDALPLESRKNLNDTSPNGQRIYEFLRAFEKTGHVEGLEEAGRLLWAQIFAQPNFSQEPRKEQFSVVRNIAARGVSEVNHRARQHPAKIQKEKPLRQTSAEKVISINATSNAFAGSPQKSWMTRGVSISPTQQHQYASPYSVQASENSMSPVPERRETARDMSFHANIPSNIDGESRVPAQEPIFHSNYTSNWQSESTNCNASMESFHITKSYKPYPSPILETNRFDQTTFSNSTQHSPWGSHTSMMTSLGSYSGYSPLPSTNQSLLQPLNDAGYQNRQISSSNSNIYDPMSPLFHPAISAEGQKLFRLRKEEERKELARITSNIHHSLSTLPDNHGDQQTESSFTIVAANTLTEMSSTGHITQIATPSSFAQQSPSPDASAAAPGQSIYNPFVIHDDMGFIHQDMNFAPNNPLPTSSRRITRSVSNSTTTPIPPPLKTTHLEISGPRSGILTSENPPPGTIISTNTQKPLSAHNAKNTSMKKAFIPIAPAPAQVDGASDSASCHYYPVDYSQLPIEDLNVDTDFKAHHIIGLPPQQESSYSSASPNPSIEFIHFDPINYYGNDDNAYTKQPVYVPPAYLAHLTQPLSGLFHPTPTHPSPPPPHLRPHTPEYLLFPPIAASSSKQIWPPPPPQIEGYRQYTFVRDRISLNMKAKRRTEIDLDTGDYRYSMDSNETSRGYKMDGTRIRTSSRYFHKKRVLGKSKKKVEQERVDDIVRKVEGVEKDIEEMGREEGDALLELLGGGFLPL